MADTRSKSLFAEAMVREVDKTFGSGIDKLEETIADQNAKIGERIHALLLLLRSRNAEEENLQVNARPASPQLSESPDFNRPEPKPNYGVNVTPDALNASSLLSNRKYKVQRRISCEEIDERRLKGLCVFCEEPETPNHHLQHKNSGILMIDSEDHLSNAEEIGVEISSDMWLSNSYGCELETGETDYDEDQDRFLIDSDLVENDVAKDGVEIDVEVASDDDKFLDAVEACETDSLIEQNELIQEQDENHSMDSVLEPSFVQHVCSPLKHQSLFDLGITTRGARQVFDTIPTRREVLSKGHKKTFHKSWRFKFKATSQPRELIQGEPWIQELKKNNPFQDLRERDQTVATDWLEGTWFFTDKSKDIQTSNSSDGKLHFDSYKLFDNRFIRSHRFQQRRKRRLSPKSWMFKYKRDVKKLQALTCSKHMRRVVSQQMRMVETSSDLLLLKGKDSPAWTASGFELKADDIASSNQEGSEMCKNNKEDVKGCFDRFQALVLMKGITDSSSSEEELIKEEPDSVKVNEVKMETQIVDREMSPSIVVLETGMEEMLGSHVTVAFVLRQTAISYSQCIDHNLFDTTLLRLQSKKNWMFKFKTSSKDYKLQIEVRKWDVNNRVWDPGGSVFQEFLVQAEATMKLWFWLNSQMWMRVRFFFLGVKKGSG